MRPGEVPVHDRETTVVVPVHGHENTAAVEAYDTTGVAAAFDQHAQGLYTYCLSRLRVPAEAANAVQDTFIIASYRAPGLGGPDRLRAWLFAVARNECHRRLQRAAPSAPLYEAAEAMDDTGQLSAITEQGELRALVRAALAELDPTEREICELNLRHGLTGADLGAVLGVPYSQAQALASRARARFERSLGVLLIARAERESCYTLATILDGSGRKPNVLVRRQVKQHIKRCPVCSGLRRPGLAPAMLLSMLTVPALPRGLRPRTLNLVSDPAPEETAYRGEVMDRAAPFGGDGFPVQLTTPTVPRGKSVVVLAAALAAAALALLGGGTYYVDYTSTHTGPPPATSSPSPTKTSSTPTKAPATKAPERTPSASAPAVIPAPVPSVVPTTAAPTHSASPKPSKSPSPTPSKSPSPTPSKSPSPTPTPTHSPTPTPTTPTPTGSTPTATPTSSA